MVIRLAWRAVAIRGTSRPIGNGITTASWLRMWSHRAARLAFAVAAHLDHEILIIDEVLAVGDASFQKKCLRKFDEVTRSGRTVLFVSHSLPTVSKLCEHAILLAKGEVQCIGPATEVVHFYRSISSAISP
jgi:lipopolysaccharide transport system ATP-binding protein